MNVRDNRKTSYVVQGLVARKAWTGLEPYYDAQFEEICTAPQMIPDRKWSPTANDPQTGNDPQIGP